MKARFVISKKENLTATGIFYLLSDTEQILFEHIATSGGWGKGYLPEGEYKVEKLVSQGEINNLPNKQAYQLFNYGWFAAITPQFQTDRDSLGIHPDGNVPGSLGCIALPFKNIEPNVKCHNLIRDGLERGSFPLTVMTTLNPWVK